MATANDILRFRLLREQLRRRSKDSFIEFVKYNDLDYQVNWHHRYIASKLQDFYLSNKKRLMLFVPPQHGKSQLASRMFPAWLFGQNPNLKIAGASYSIDLARSFNRDIQRIMDGEYYHRVFPHVYLNSKRTITTESYLKNSEEFEIVGYKGSYKSVGVMGGLSGRKVDIAIIDDPVKDAIEANSQTYRERLWDWYLNVLVTRLHNDSKILLIMTRWHEDDLAGRLLRFEPSKWQVIKLPAIKEDNSNPDDIREIGDALWPERHSLGKLNDLRHLSERTFISLYQQRPAPIEGGLIKRNYFEIVDSVKYNDCAFTIDGAYTKNTANDPTVILKYTIKDNILYVLDVWREWLEFPQLVKKIQEVAKPNDRIYIEPKASGLSIVQYLKQQTNFSVIKDKTPITDKISRLHGVLPYIESGRVRLIKGVWNDLFLTEMAVFPNGTHDDQVDCLVMALNKLGKPKIITTVAN